jgi:hypothetical protein
VLENLVMHLAAEPKGAPTEWQEELLSQ